MPRKEEDKALEADLQAVLHAVVLHPSLAVGEDNETEVLCCKYATVQLVFRILGFVW